MPRAKEFLYFQLETGVKLRPKSNWTSLMIMDGMRLSFAFHQVFEIRKHLSIATR